jgi:uncharacterized membrane protein
MTEPTQTGLSDNSAGALAYVTFIPAIVFLAMPPYNQSPYVRFHAWQSILLSAVWVVLYVVLVVIAMVTVFFAPFLITILNLLIFLTVFVVWLMCVVQALNGKRFMVPIIGAFAAKQAGV